MGIRLVLSMILSWVIGFNASAAPKKEQTTETTYETVVEPEIQVEETEVVKASPLNAPESSRLRQKRQQMEMETEEEFIQRLEEARMEDEKARRVQIFERELRVEGSDDAESYMDPAQDAEKEMDYRPVQSNQVTTTVIGNESPEEQKKFYISVLAGGLNHQANNTPDVNGAFGAAAGLALGYDVWVEGGFFYSFFESDNAFLADEEIDQFTFTAGPKYTFGLSNHWITPVVGALLGYTRRQYNGGDNSSNALDAGVSLGAEMALNKSVRLGLEGRYMTNIDYDKDQALNSTDKALEELASGANVEPLENFDYTVIMANLKMVF